MIRVLVGYYSRTGTTEKMAEKVTEGVRNSDADVEVDLKEITEVDVETLPDYDAVILGSPTYYGLPAAEVKKFLDESVTHHGDLDGMVGGAFSSSSNKAGGNESTILALLEALLIHGMAVRGDPEGDHYGPVVVGEPEDGDLEQCKRYGDRLAKFTELVCG
ncbi:flavodoxin [candidate division MSBL1 archaeon SCGC-AAA259I07]|uniref:Flavodoxin n=2 Tax=candidate division MSBL1 TaxID=215777 RepID=A0A133U917_9EURY|nr:flavodoxin [candidate division MSBL1 archaeon SCGC-AAA259B11]KXA95512.1 flavodoxin [candidate division MSBL1 archaeon SCGC-AAA259I07]